MVSNRHNNLLVYKNTQDMSDIHNSRQAECANLASTCAMKGGTVGHLQEDNTAQKGFTLHDGPVPQTPQADMLCGIQASALGKAMTFPRTCCRGCAQVHAREGQHQQGHHPPAAHPPTHTPNHTSTSPDRSCCTQCLTPSSQRQPPSASWQHTKDLTAPGTRPRAATHTSMQCRLYPCLAPTQGTCP